MAYFNEQESPPGDSFATPHSASLPVGARCCTTHTHCAVPSISPPRCRECSCPDHQTAAYPNRSGSTEPRSEAHQAMPQGRAPLELVSTQNPQSQPWLATCPQHQSIGPPQPRALAMPSETAE